MFAVKKPDSLLWPVKVNVPIGDGSMGTEPGEFKMRFKYLDVDELNQVLARLAVAADAGTVKPYILGWDELADENGKTLIFSPENLDEVMKISYMVVGINKAFIDCQVGRETKN